MSYAPVALFCYKRLDKLQHCIEALENNCGTENTVLYIFCDGSKDDKDYADVQKVRSFISNYKITNSNFLDVHLFEKDKNQGLSHSIISGVSQVLKENDRVVVVEDDLITSPYFLNYMNQALDFYHNMKEYISISGFTFPLKSLKTYNRDIYVTRKAECWGWGTWADRWEKVDWSVGSFSEYVQDRKKRAEFNSIEFGLDQMLIDQQNGRVDSWAVRWCYHAYINKLLTVYPRVSLTHNIGFDSSGTNCELLDEKYSGDINNGISQFIFERLPGNRKIERESSRYIHRRILDMISFKIGLFRGTKL